MAQVDIGFSVGRVMVLGKKLFDQEKFNRLMDCQTVAEALKLLYDVQYGKGTTVDNPNNFDIILENELLDAVALLKELLGDKNSIGFFLAKYDYLNAKTIFKSRLNGEEGTKHCFAGSRVPPSVMQQAVNTKNYKALEDNLKQACEKIEAKFADGSITPRFVDVTLDKSMFLEMMRCAKQSRLSLLKKLLVFEIDCLNILMMFRCKKTNQKKQEFLDLYLPNGNLKQEFLSNYFDRTTGEFLQALPASSAAKPFAVLANKAFLEGSLLDAETAISKGKLEILQSKKSVETVQPIVEYFLNRTAEIDKIRFVLICIKNGIEKQSIKERLKKLYA